VAGLDKAGVKPFRLELDNPAQPRIHVGGEDVTRVVNRATLDIQPGQLPVLYLECDSDTVIGEAVVRTVTGVEDAQEAILGFLDAIDPAELEAKALESVGMGSGNGTELILEQLRGWARGES
jgi:hypothetical protein